jgi:hypothetical protein
MEGTLAFLCFAASAVLFALRTVDNRFGFAALAAGFAFALANVPQL